ncbi:hypothetical protein AKJ16_DCAP20692, partial [Drosera capensis]
PPEFRKICPAKVLKLNCCIECRAKVSYAKHGEHGWIHLRQSIHSLNIAVNMQSLVPGGCQSMARVLVDKFLVTSGMNKVLDISQIRSYAESGNNSQKKNQSCNFLLQAGEKRRRLKT